LCQHRLSLCAFTALNQCTHSLLLSFYDWRQREQLVKQLPFGDRLVWRRVDRLFRG
jgi:hypothetical protein